MFWLGLLIVIAVIEVSLVLIGALFTEDWVEGVIFAIGVTVLGVLAFGATCAVIFGLGLMGVV